MAEKIANVLTASDGTIGTLTAPIAADSTTLELSAPFPAPLQDGTVRVRVGTEIILATVDSEGAVTDLERGVEQDLGGGPAASHAAGSKVRHVLTAGSLTAQSGSLPAGGTTGQVLAKASDEDGDAEWVTGGDVPADASTSSKGLIQLAGDLAGTASSPQIASGAITNTEINASAAIAESKLNLASDAAAGTASRRTLGTGSTQAAAGNHTHTGLSVQAAGTASVRQLGTGSTDAAAGNDARFPTSDQKAALAGTDGTPSAANPVVTDSDPRVGETYVWDTDTEAYVLVDQKVRVFVGPEPPEDHGFTMRDADVWDSSEVPA